MSSAGQMASSQEQEGAAIMQEHIFPGRIASVVIFRVPEFGPRVCFTIEVTGQCPVVCAVEGDLAREFIGHYSEGDRVVAKGLYESRPSTAAANCPWVPRLRVRAVRVLEDARLAA